MSALKGEQSVSRQTTSRENPGSVVRRRTASSDAGTSPSSPRGIRKTASSVGEGTGRPRRKVVYRVAANGVETRLPAIPILHFSWQWVSGMIAVLLLLFTIILINSPMFRVNTLTIQGLSRYSQDEFKPLLKGRKTSIFLFNRENLTSALLLSHPELVNPQVDIAMPNQIVVTAAEREPILQWVANGQTYWVDEEGVILEPRGEAGNLIFVESPVSPPLAKQQIKDPSIVDYARLWIEKKVSAMNNQAVLDRMDAATLKAVIGMNAILPAGASLVYDPVAGMGWRDPGGWEVYFGTDLSNVEFKLVEYQTILARLNEMGLTPAMISVEHVDSPYFRTE